MTAAGLEHLPDPATYDCLGCEKPWPCDPAREHLKTNVADLVHLATLLWTELEQAAPVLRHEPPTVLFERFLRWSR
jgi:hypothetical protein